MDNFRSLLLSLSEDIINDDLDSMKFCCKPQIGAGVLEKINRPIQLFGELEKRSLLGPDNKKYLADILEKVGRHDLRNKLLGIQVPNAPIVTGSLNDSHLTEISEDLGSDWKRLGRKLEVKETILDNIDVDHRRVKEKSCQVMLRWKRVNGVNATGQALADALTLINRKDVAESLADICRIPGLVVQERNVAIPAEQVENTRGPLAALPNDFKSTLPTQEIKNPKKDERDSPGNLEEQVVVADSLSGPMELNNEQSNTRMPTQEISPPQVQSLMGILDPARYFVLKEIGRGSCGKVYMCTTKDKQHTYAVKQVDLGMENKETIKQVKLLKKEIDILKHLRHENIVTLFYAEDTSTSLSIFMEYLPKGSIYDHVSNKGRMKETIVRKYTCQILKGCEYLHQEGIIHMDIKGANVLIDDHDNIRLADFGIAKKLENATLTSTTGFRGTLYWSSPELANGDKPTYVFDIWSVGCTVVEMLTTKPPNHNLGYTAALLKISKREVYPPEDLSQLAKTFIEMCFEVKENRPNATDLLKNDFPSE